METEGALSVLAPVYIFTDGAHDEFISFENFVPAFVPMLTKISPNRMIVNVFFFVVISEY